ncbi:MAG TPA: PD-(D/E)XK nuclease family protein [Anaeromyxobacteraceae bacterium]|nr:PD-(D/E)XK nuclease family protein [Anaeromyxobacteraceae bacterium]
MGNPHPVLRDPSEWADAVAALPAEGALPLRTALVPGERHAHSLRRALVRSGRGAALAGLRLVGSRTLAREILGEAGRVFRRGEESLRPSRLRALLGEDLPLEHLDLRLLREAPGWPEALAAAIGDLESAGLAPDRLPATGARWRDLALLWRHLDAAAGRSLTAARILSEAADLLEAGARPETGPVLAAVTGRETAVEARFVRALPGTTVALLAARPLRDRHLVRVAALFGAGARDALEAAPAPEASRTERDLVARFLFAPPERLADPARPRSAGPDGTVSLEEHSGPEAEIEAAAGWVAREVLERGTPLEEMAVLVPVLDPLAGLVAARLSRLPWKDGALPVHVAGGLPAVSLAGGARTLALVDALAGFLPAEALAALLPALRAEREEPGHLSHGDAAQLAWSLGTVGGSAADRDGALFWLDRARAREAALEAELARLEADPAAEEHEVGRARSDLGALRAVRPALDALVGLCRLVLEGRPLSEIAPALLGFMQDWLLDPDPGTPVRALLSGPLEAACADALVASLRGPDALEVVRERLLALRVPAARFGEPAVYVGTLAGAAGLEFGAVRILGLAEGSLPARAAEDPVLPDRLREEADPRRVPTSADRALAQLHAFDRAVRGASRAVALSAPRSDLDRSEREVSSLLLEAGAALGRPDPVEPGAVIPGLRSLSRTSFGPARAAAAAFRLERPVSDAARLDRAAARGEVLSSWTSAPHLDLGRILALREPAGLGPADGVLGPEGPFPPLPGLDPARPISASALERLLHCPLAFLRSRILGWEEPPGPPALRELDARRYGTLFHDAMEVFYRENGPAFVARERSLPEWKKRARELAEDALAALLATYPLVGRGVRERERSRLLADVASFLEHDWELPLSRFVAVERSFGRPEAVVLDAGGRPLHVRGRMDRIDVEGEHALLRDLKTGRAHPRTGEEAGPTPVRDVQIGLYALVARGLARSWGLPERLAAAYVYARTGEERAFRGADEQALERAARGWLALSASLLAERAFPPTPEPEDCALCPFRPVCGDAVPARAAAARPGAGGAVAAFLALKASGGEGDR